MLALVQAALTEGLVVSVLVPDGLCATKLSSLGVHVILIPEVRLSQGKKSIVDICRFLINSLCTFTKHFCVLRKADLVYVNGNRLLPVALLAVILLGKNAAFHIHLNHEATELWLFLQTLRLKRTKAIIVPSPFVQRMLVDFDSRFKDPRVCLIENGLDSRFANAPFKDVFTGIPLRHIGIVGRVSPEKGQDVLPSLARNFPQLTFHVLGDSAFSDDTFAQKLISDAPENVIFHGWIDDIPSKVNEIGLQVCLVPSRVCESSSLVSMQMTALGILVLVRMKGALEDLSRELGLDAFVVDEDITELLRQLMKSSDTELSVRSRKSYGNAIALYGFATFQQRLRSLLRSLVKEK